MLTKCRETRKWCPFLPLTPPVTSQGRHRVESLHGRSRLSLPDCSQDGLHGAMFESSVIRNDSSNDDDDIQSFHGFKKKFYGLFRNSPSHLPSPLPVSYLYLQGPQRAQHRHTQLSSTGLTELRQPTLQLIYVYTICSATVIFLQSFIPNLQCSWQTQAH